MTLQHGGHRSWLVEKEKTELTRSDDDNDEDAGDVNEKNNGEIINSL